MAPTREFEKLSKQVVGAESWLANIIRQKPAEDVNYSNSKSDPPNFDFLIFQTDPSKATDRQYRIYGGAYFGPHIFRGIFRYETTTESTISDEMDGSWANNWSCGR